MPVTHDQARCRKVARAAGIAALLLATGAVVILGARTPGYAQSLHPVALLGTREMAAATWFNLCAFVLPGMLCTCVAWCLRAGAHGFRARVGCQLLLLSALAFAAQGVWPLDATDLDGPASRLHASLWMAWLLAFVAGTAAVAASARLPHGLRALAVTCALLVPTLALLAGSWMPVAIAQRLAFVAWLAWWPLAAGFIQGEAAGPARVPPAER